MAEKARGEKGPHAFAGAPEGKPRQIIPGAEFSSDGGKG